MSGRSAFRVVIAGGSSGIGFATARLLANQGAEVVITARDAQRLEAARQLVGPNAAALAFDASDREQRSQAFDRIGKFDHLVIALSGGKGAGPFPNLDPDAVRSGFEKKFWVHFALAQECLGQLSPDGSITFVTAISATAANPGTSGLAAINAAIEGLVRPLAVELRPRRVNAVAPGVIDTPWWDWLPAGEKAALFARYSAATPAGRVGTPEDVAGAVVFLIGNSFMTGCLIPCDGGLRLVGQGL